MTSHHRSTHNSFSAHTSLTSKGETYHYYSLPAAAKALGCDVNQLPFSLKILLENLLRHEDGVSVNKEDITTLAAWDGSNAVGHEIAFRPARVLMQDFTGVPAVVDLAAMRDAVVSLGGNAKKINPLAPVDLVIDHSVMVDRYGTAKAFEENVALEMERNAERYAFLRWGQEAFEQFRVVPPGTGICHQVNLEYLAEVAWSKETDGQTVLVPDSLVGTDSHTTMINGLSVLGWGVGGIEAEAAMLGQPISMLVPEVVGVCLSGALPEGTTATDLVLRITEMLRAHGVVGKFVEFCGPGLSALSLADRATIANMAPEYGATCGFFPVDEETLNYLRLSGRSEALIARVEAYAKAQSLWYEPGTPEPRFTDRLELNLATIEPAMAGPKRPQDRITLAGAKVAFDGLAAEAGVQEAGEGVAVPGKDWRIQHGAVVIAAITSCTNTSNPDVMLAAGLVAQKARARGLTVPGWVKTSLAPGSKVVTEYLEQAGLQEELDALGFTLVGYGCTTCIGNSGGLDPELDAAIRKEDVLVTSVLSGNRNFEGRVHPLTRGNYLMSPPLVVAYALAGTMDIDLQQEALGTNQDGQPVYLKDIWPSTEEIKALTARIITPQMFAEKYADVFTGTKEWQAIDATPSLTYPWSEKSTYIQLPPYFEGMTRELASVEEVRGARLLALLGDSITTDHISPAGAIAKESPAAEYLREQGVAEQDFNSYGSRRGNHQVMMRGTFANVRIKNRLAPGTEGGVTTHIPSGEVCSIFDAAVRYREEHTPLIVIGGKDYGMGSSRDWAAKGTRLLGVKAVIAESFERIHRSNLVGMGVLPLQFTEGTTQETLGLTGQETFDITGLSQDITPKMEVTLHIHRADGSSEDVPLLTRIDTETEVEYFHQGGILHTVVRQLAG